MLITVFLLVGISVSALIVSTVLYILVRAFVLRGFKSAFRSILGLPYRLCVWFSNLIKSFIVSIIIKIWNFFRDDFRNGAKTVVDEVVQTTLGVSSKAVDTVKTGTVSVYHGMGYSAGWLQDHPWTVVFGMVGSYAVYALFNKIKVFAQRSRENKEGKDYKRCKSIIAEFSADAAAILSFVAILAGAQSTVLPALALRVNHMFTKTFSKHVDTQVISDGSIELKKVPFVSGGIVYNTSLFQALVGEKLFEMKVIKNAGLLAVNHVTDEKTLDLFLQKIWDDDTAYYSTLSDDDEIHVIAEKPFCFKDLPTEFVGELIAKGTMSPQSTETVVIANSDYSEDELEAPEPNVTLVNSVITDNNFITATMDWCRSVCPDSVNPAIVLISLGAVFAFSIGGVAYAIRHFLRRYYYKPQIKSGRVHIKILDPPRSTRQIKFKKLLAPVTKNEAKHKRGKNKWGRGALAKRLSAHHIKRLWRRNGDLFFEYDKGDAPWGIGWEPIYHVEELTNYEREELYDQSSAWNDDVSPDVTPDASDDDDDDDRDYSYASNRSYSKSRSQSPDPYSSGRNTPVNNADWSDVDDDIRREELKPSYDDFSRDQPGRGGGGGMFYESARQQKQEEYEAHQQNHCERCIQLGHFCGLKLSRKQVTEAPRPPNKIPVVDRPCKFPSCSNKRSKKDKYCSAHKDYCLHLKCIAKSVHGKRYCSTHLIIKDKVEGAMGAGSIDLSQITLVPIFINTGEEKLLFDGHGFPVCGVILTCFHVAFKQDAFARIGGKFVLLKQVGALPELDLKWYSLGKMPPSLHYATPVNGARVTVVHFTQGKCDKGTLDINDRDMVTSSSPAYFESVGYWKHTCDTKAGHSGSPMLNAEGRVVGVHKSTSPNDKKNYFVPLDNEIFSKITKSMTPAQLTAFSSESVTPSVSAHDSFLDKQGKKKPLIELNQSCSFTQMVDSPIVRAPFTLLHRYPLRSYLQFDQNAWDLLASYVDEETLHSFQPAPINVESCQKAVAKYFLVKETSIDDKAFSKASVWFKVMISPIISNFSILNHQQYLNCYNKDSSPGVCFPSMDREEFMNSFEPYFDWYWDKIGNCSGDRTVHSLFMKVELRSKERVFANKARGFLGASSFANYAGVRLLKNALDILHEAKHLPLWPGKCSWFGNWGRLFDKFSDKSNVFGTDVNDWDGSFPIIAHMFFCSFFYENLHPKFKTAENWSRFYNHFFDLGFTFVALPDGCVFVKPLGMPSGALFTLDGNSMWNLFLFMYSFAYRYPTAQYEDLSQVVCMFCGDDNQFGSNDIFTPFMYIEGAGHFGFSVRMENSTLETMHFLNSTFVDCPCGCGVKMPSVCPGKLLGALIWTPSVDPLKQLERACNIVPMLWPSPNYFESGLKLIKHLKECAQIDHFDGELSLAQIHVLYHGYESMNPHSRLVKNGFKIDERHSSEAIANKIDSYRIDYYPNFFLKENELVQSRSFNLSSTNSQISSSMSSNSKTIIVAERPPRRNTNRNNPQTQVVEVIGSDVLPRGSNKRRSARRRRARQMAKASIDTGMSTGYHGSSGSATVYVTDKALSTVAAGRRSMRGRAQKVLGPQFDKFSAYSAEYVKTLINPGVCQDVRIPDTAFRKTATASSVQVFDITPIEGPLNPDDLGRFSICFQPKFGSTPLNGATACPNTFQTMILDNNSVTNNWSAFSLITCYNTMNGGVDPRLDSNYAQLTQADLSFFDATIVGVSVLAPRTPISAMIVQVPPTYGLTPKITNVGAVSTVTLPAGEWRVHLSIRVDTGASLPMSFAFNTLDSLVVIDNSSTVVELQDIEFLVTSDGKNLNNFTVQWNGGAAPVQEFGGSSMTIAPAFTDAVTSFGNGGLTRQMRPVSAGALLTFEGSTLNNGGQISGGYLPADSMEMNFLTDNPNPSIGQLQNWEKLAKVSGSYNGRLEFGTYVWWAPEEVDDFNFYDVETANARAIPTIIISGQYQGPSLTGALRLICWANYEITTEQRFLPVKSINSSIAERDAAMLFLRGLPHAVPNAKHAELIRYVLGKLGSFVRSSMSFYNENKESIHAGLGAALKIGTAAAAFI